MENRMLDRRNYSAKTMENFEIISAYYVDIFYNHLYTEAKKLKVAGNVSSVTEGYKHTLNAFLNGLSNPKLYKKSIAGLHHYYITIGFASISYSNCIDRLTNDFVPSDYFASLTFTQKVGVFRLVINQAIKTFIRKIVDQYLTKIIDYHKDKDNVRLLQDELIDILILEREGFYQRFIATQTKTNKNETVNRLLAEKMQNEIKRLVTEKYEQKRQINILKKAYIQKKENENKLNEIISDLRSKIQSLGSGSITQVNPNITSTAILAGVGSGGIMPSIISTPHIKLHTETSSDDDKVLHDVKKKEPCRAYNTSSEWGDITYSAAGNPEDIDGESVAKLKNDVKPIIKYNAEPINAGSVANRALVRTHASAHASTPNSAPNSTPSSAENSAENSDADSDGDGSNFIEVNKNNMSDILQSDNDFLRKFSNRSNIDITMEEGTTLENF